MASTLEKTEASKKFQEVGLSETKADLIVKTLTKNEDDTYNAADVEKLKEDFASAKSDADTLFKKYDEENTGFLTVETAVKAAKERFPKLSEASVEKMVASFDKDKNDKIDVQELKEFFISLPVLREVLLACFNEMDADKNETLEEDELEKILTEKLGLFPGQGKTLMKFFDQDGDNKISKEEFLQRDQFVNLWARLFDEK